MSRTTPLASCCLVAIALTASASTNQVTVLEKAGQVEAAFAGTNRWLAAETNLALHIDDRIRTGERSRATLHLLDQSTMRMAELTEFLVEPLSDAPDKPSFNLGKGLLYFFHRDKPVDVQFKTRTATAAIRGTEFHLAVADNGRTELTMFDGEVRLANQFGAVVLRSGEQGTVEPGQAPVKSPALNARSVIQWCLYYPGVLDADELRFDPAVQAALVPSLEAYRSGDLLGALEAVPTSRPSSDAGTAYYAALLLSVGKAEQAAASVGGQNNATASALRAIIATVKGETNSTLLGTNSATESLARSYQLQARSRLPEALDAAHASVVNSPQFGFGWARVAELEFGFGRAAEAKAALDKALALSPRNAQAITLRGFTLAARNRIGEASAEFDRAIAADGALANAWLGRGLCRIRRGDLAGGRADLQVAATLEPQRALLRSYLAKAWTELGDTKHATNELALAVERDANDPTAWLYSALLLQQENRINEAVNELERSQELNDNRRIYRSRLLLDQDRAVRGANLATIYRDAGMTDVSLREASTAVNADYANPAAHKFLSDSFTALQDPNAVNLRHETPAIAEHLIANLLSPVGASSLSRLVSQNEYSRLFERNRLGLVTDATYLSRGAWSLAGAQFGILDGTAYAVEAGHREDPGSRPNGDLEERTLTFRIHQQVTARDTLYVEATDSILRAGDLAGYYNPGDANPSLRIKDAIQPTFVAGWHREWSPASHTLLLASYLRSELTVKDPGGNVSSLALQTNSAGDGIIAALPIYFTQDYVGRLDIYSGELQHILQADRHATIGGVMFQAGNFDTRNSQDNPDVFEFTFDTLPVVQDASAPFERFKGYAYHRWQATDAFRLEGGLTCDWMKFPANHRSAPIADDEQTESQWSPKAGAVWTPQPGTVVRGGYAQALGGTSFDQSFQLEPTEVAGFNQSFRSIIPESIAGANAGAKFEMAGLSLEHRLGPRTHAALTANWLRSRVDREIGAFVLGDGLFDTFSIGSTPQRLDYIEQSLAFNVHQLLGNRWVASASYRISRAELEQDFTAIPEAAYVDPLISARSRTEAVLQRLDLGLTYNHPSGFFCTAQGQWWHQSNHEDASALGSEDMWQANFFAGWRLWQRKAELAVGVLNLTDEDYSLNPVNYFVEPPRERTLLVRFRLNL